VDPKIINAIIQVEKLKNDDKFFNEFGIEEEIIEANIDRLQLADDPEVKQIV